MGHIPAMDMLSASLAFIDGLGAPEMLLIFVLVLVLFGGNKLPEFARGLGKTMREFKKAASGVEEEFRRALDEDERKQNVAKYEPPPALPPGSTDATTTTPDPAGPGDSPNYHDEYGHEYYENQDGTTDTAAPANSGNDLLKTGAPGSTDTPAPAATPPPAAADAAVPTAPDVPPAAAAPNPPPPDASGTPPSSRPPGPAATP